MTLAKVLIRCGSQLIDIPKRPIRRKGATTMKAIFENVCVASRPERIEARQLS